MANKGQLNKSCYFCLVDYYAAFKRMKYMYTHSYENSQVRQLSKNPNAQ